MSVVSCQLPSPIVNGKWDSCWKWKDFQLWRTHDLDLGSGHTAYLHASLIDLYLHAKFHRNPRNFLWTDGRTFEIHSIRLIQKSRPKNGLKKRPITGVWLKNGNLLLQKVNIRPAINNCLSRSHFRATKAWAIALVITLTVLLHRHLVPERTHLQCPDRLKNLNLPTFKWVARWRNG